MERDRNKPHRHQNGERPRLTPRLLPHDSQGPLIVPEPAEPGLPEAAHYPPTEVDAAIPRARLPRVVEEPPTIPQHPMHPSVELGAVEESGTGEPRWIVDDVVEEPLGESPDKIEGVPDEEVDPPIGE